MVVENRSISLTSTLATTSAHLDREGIVARQPSAKPPGGRGDDSVGHDVGEINQPDITNMPKP